LYCSRGNAWLGLQQNDSALQDLNKAVELDPHYPTAYFSRSEVFERMSETEQADADRETAMRLQRQMSQAYLESQGIEFEYSLG
jgi:Tfp pilus assembly protein PilF